MAGESSVIGQLSTKLDQTRPMGYLTKAMLSDLGQHPKSIQTKARELV